MRTWSRKVSRTFQRAHSTRFESFYCRLTAAPRPPTRSLCSLRGQAVQVVDQREGHQLGCGQPAQSGHGQPADGESSSDATRSLENPLPSSVSERGPLKSSPQELFPANKRSCEHFAKYFTDAGLKELSDFARNQQSIGARKELQKELQEQMSRGDPQKEVRWIPARMWSIEIF